MSSRTLLSSRSTGRLTTSALIVMMFILALSTCVLGLVVWKGYDARRNALAQSETEIRNLAHSLGEHASHSFQAADVVMDNIITFIIFKPFPDRAKFNTRLREVADNLPQIHELAVFDAKGDLAYASLDPAPVLNNADRDYFVYHRDHADKALRITGPIVSRATGRPVIALTRRLDDANGGFAGVVIATIDSDYFTDFYKGFDLGADGGIGLVGSDGRILIRWPLAKEGSDLSKSQLFEKLLLQSPRGYNLATSPFDGLTKYYAYEQLSRYPLVVTVARTEHSILSGWREGVRSDIVVATGMLACIVLLAAALAARLRNHQSIETLLRERDARHRLIDANIGDVVVLLDNHGVVNFVSKSVETVLGFAPEEVTGRTYLDLMHPDDIAGLRTMAKRLADSPAGLRAEFRMERADGTMVWLEANFRFTRSDGKPSRNIVCTLRDVTRRKAMEDEVEALNTRLAELARTDGLTGLPNRRALDDFIARGFDADTQVSVLMIDVDYFKGYNDCLGHQAGDVGLKLISSLLAREVDRTGGLAARYGGEEFAIILPGADAAAAIAWAEATRIKIHELDLVNPAAPGRRLTVSIGVASRSAATPDAGALIRDADLALYEAKHRGRNCSVAASAFIGDAGPLVPDAAGPTFLEASLNDRRTRFPPA